MKDNGNLKNKTEFLLICDADMVARFLVNRTGGNWDSVILMPIYYLILNRAAKNEKRYNKLLQKNKLCHKDYKQKPCTRRNTSDFANKSLDHHIRNKSECDSVCD